MSWLAQSQPNPPVLCHFRRFTGMPCPTCGSTRAGMAAFEGRFADAIAFNPFMCAAAVVALAWAVMRFGFGRKLVLSRGVQVGFWSAAALLLAVNWGYLIWRG
jgi:hypothetical protein